jgi:hypothetical protein
MDRPGLVLVASLVSVFGASCTSPPAVLLTVGADAPVEQYDLYVRDDATSMVVFHSGFNAVQVPGEAPRDLTRSSLKIALKMGKGGNYTLLMVGVIGEVLNGKPADGSTQLFWAGRVTVDGATEVSAKLLTVAAGDDADGDLWPDPNKFFASNAEAQGTYGGHLDLLDCNDDPASMPVDKDGKALKFKAADINPFAIEVCGDGYDEDCDGDGDEPCIDSDKDGDPSITDCDDNDPSRHRATLADPFPDPKNCCGYNLGRRGTPDEFRNLVGTEGLCPGTGPRCGNGIDESCQGQDTECVIDADCDGDPAKPVGNDCDDADPAVHFNALEPCGSDKDLNCDGVVNGGCIPCDLDGDDYERNDAANGCPDKMDKHPGMFDCNDYDSSVFPGATVQCGGNEAGVNAIGRLTCSLRQFCRTLYEPTGMTGTAKISSFGWLIGDMDCNGTAYEGCPSTACDKDGDGWPANDGVCPAVDSKFDCDDNDPTFYPGAPVSCGAGAAEDCTNQREACANDSDGDGWNAGPDCKDDDPTVHPWALELCDGKDNDCDAIVDEGNPNVTGMPLVSNGQVASCTDNNVGECGKTFGVCVCSIASPMSVTNAADRIACPTETGGAAKPPRCFGAGQPHPQSCDADAPRDDDCNGANDDVAGVNLAIKGMPCGIAGPGALGQCKQGVVVGCDSSQVSCFARYNTVPTSQSWYVCSSDAVCPIDEQCNGLDDDCDGLLAGNQTANPPLNLIPANDEIDHDGDGFIACTTCGSAMLPMTLMGCGDCDDTTNKRFPGRTEECDNIDNSCDPAWAVSPPGSDGKDQCVGGTTCCSGQLACRNLNSDKANCGACGTVCDDPKRANVCDPALHCACNTIPQCTGANFCDPSGSGTCKPCSENGHCGDTCDPCGAGQSCQPLAGMPGRFSCGCVSDTGCTSPGQPYCNLGSGACQALAPQGHTCGGPVTCAASLTCVDGYCCNSACSGAANACAACNLPGNLGTCTAVGAGMANPGSKTCAGSGSCIGTCQGSAACSFPTSSCGTASCNTTTNRFVAVGTCSGSPNGTCNQAADAPCPNNLRCENTTSCRASCTSDAHCLSGFFCNNAGACQSQKTLNQSCMLTGGGTNADCYMSGNCAECGANLTCNVAAQQCKLVNGQSCSGVPANCTTGLCPGGICCNEACNGGCANGCSTGTCAADSLGTTCSDDNKRVCDGVATTCPSTCQNNNQCTTGNYCSGGGACTPCSSGGACNAAQRCFGLCGSGNYCDAGFCGVCNDDVACGSSCTNCTLQATNKVCVGGTSCGCTTDSDCAATSYCNSGTCTACATNAPCGGGSNHCGNGNCGANNWCNGTPGNCVSCSTSLGGPCSAAQACFGLCGSGNYCRSGTNVCASCSTGGDDTHCGAACGNCTTMSPKRYCANTTVNSCQLAAPTASPCPALAGGMAACAPGNGSDCLQCVNVAGTVQSLCGAGPNCP